VRHLDVSQVPGEVLFPQLADRPVGTRPSAASFPGRVTIIAGGVTIMETMTSRALPDARTLRRARRLLERGAR
jgi:hypothetical protein